MASSEIRTCECGLTWRLRKVKIIMRDSDYLGCTCGRELINWHGGHMWTGELISDLAEESKGV